MEEFDLFSEVIGYFVQVGLIPYILWIMRKRKARKKHIEDMESAIQDHKNEILTKDLEISSLNQRIEMLKDAR